MTSSPGLLSPSCGRIPATVVTGFLGAGKTSLIHHVVARAQRRVALIVNEFGAVGVDGGLLGDCGCDDIVELANGCICCTVAEDFLPTMEKILQNPPEHIIIETSGLALPAPLVRAFSWPEIRTRVCVDGVIAVVDAPALAAGQFAADEDAVDQQRQADPALDHHDSLAALFADQVTGADLVILNKTDQIDAAGLVRARDLLAGHLRAQTHVVEAAKAQVDARIILGINGEETRPDALFPGPEHHPHDDHDHDHDAFTSLSLCVPDSDDPVVLSERVRTLSRAHGLLRVKGVIHVPGKPRRLIVQGVGERVDHYFGAPWAGQEPRTSTLVVIGRAGLDVDALCRAFSAKPV